MVQANRSEADRGRSLRQGKRAIATDISAENWANVS